MLHRLHRKLRDLMAQSPISTTPSAGNNEQLSLPLASAILLFEVAWADHNVSAAEEAALKHALIKLHDLSDENAQQILVASREQHRDSVGVYPYTRLLNDSLSKAEKFELMVQLWSLALVDDGLDQFEEHRIRAIAELIYVEHADFIAAKQQARARAQP